MYIHRLLIILWLAKYISSGLLSTIISSIITANLQKIVSLLDKTTKVNIYFQFESFIESIKKSLHMWA